MCNLMNTMFLVLICTFVLSVFYLKFYVFSYLTEVLSFLGLIFFLPVLGSFFVADFLVSVSAYLFTDHL